MYKLLKKLGVAQKVAFWVVGALVTVVVVNSSALDYYVHGELDRLGKARLQENLAIFKAMINPHRDAFALRDGKLMLGDRVMDGDEDGLDSFVAAAGGVVTIFKGDVRVATTIMKDGKRALGTSLGAGPVHDAVFNRGERFIGEADILGKPYVTAYDPIIDPVSNKVIGVLFVGLSVEEFGSLTSTITKITIGIGAVVAFLLSVAAYVGLRRMLSPFGPLTKLMVNATDGHLPENVPHQKRGDEFGALARAINAFGNAMRTVQIMRDKQEAAERQALAERRRDMLALAQSMDSEILGSIAAIARQVDTLKDASAKLLQHADNSSEQAEGVAAASQQTSSNVQTVASATEELNASSSEIGRQVEQSTTVADTAATRTQDVEVQISSLVESAAKIGQVVVLISDIASQTNLLALNATIEAARAGEAGKGFAVVAHEVKQLASQTARATDEISQQISAIQGESQNTAKAVKEVGGIVDAVHENASSIAAAIQEQHAAIAEISRNVQHAAAGTDEINRRITSVSQGTTGTRSAAQEVASAASSLADASARMENEVVGFIERIRRNNAA